MAHGTQRDHELWVAEASIAGFREQLKALGDPEHHKHLECLLAQELERLKSISSVEPDRSRSDPDVSEPHATPE